MHYLYIFITLLLLPFSLESMEKQPAALQALPKELRSYIAVLLARSTKGKTINDAATIVKKALIIGKAPGNKTISIADEPLVNKELSQKLAEAYDVSPVHAALLLNTPGARAWLSNYIKTPEGHNQSVEAFLKLTSLPLSAQNSDALKLLIATGFTLAAPLEGRSRQLLNSVDLDYTTALTRAIQYGYLPLVTLLIQAGATINIVNNKRETALTIAQNQAGQSKEKGAIADLLQKINDQIRHYDAAVADALIRGHAQTIAELESNPHPNSYWMR